MGVGIESGLNLLMPQTVCHGYRGKPKLNQKAGVAVPEIMDTDGFCACHFNASFHFMFKKMFSVWENAVMFLEAVELVRIAF